MSYRLDYALTQCPICKNFGNLKDFAKLMREDNNEQLFILDGTCPFCGESFKIKVEPYVDYYATVYTV